MDINLLQNDSLDNGINFLTDRFSDFKSFLADIQLPEYGDFFEYPFPLNCIPSNLENRDVEWYDFSNKDEILFYSHCIEQGKSEEIAELIGLIIDLNCYIKQRYATDCIWENTEIPFGLVPSGLLALNDQNYINLFIKFLATNDLKHETYQYYMIRSIVEKHGWNEATLKLCFSRATELMGQNGLIQLDEFLGDMGLDQYLTTEEGIQHWFSLKASMQDDDLDDVLELVDLALRDIRAYEDQKSEGFDNQLDGLRVYIISQNWFDTFKEAVIYVSARGGIICDELDEQTQIALSNELDWPEELTAKAESLNILRIWKTITTRKEAKETLKRIYGHFDKAIESNNRSELASMLVKYPQIINDYNEHGYFERMLQKKLKASQDLSGLVYLIGRHADSRWLYETLHHHRISKLLQHIDDNDELSPEFLNQSLFLAITDEDVEAIEELIERGASIAHARGIGNQGPMEWAFWSGNAPKLSVIETLLKKGADPNEKNAKGKTPLMFAISKIGQTNSSFVEWKRIIDLLIQHGANILEMDKQGNCILDYAKTLSNNSQGILKSNIDNLIDNLF